MLFRIFGKSLSIIMNNSSFIESINVAYMNIQGQSGLSNNKQLQIQDFLHRQSIDILHCQEIDIDNDSFRNCNLITSNYNIIQNNSINKYGTASLVRNDFLCENIRMDTLVKYLVCLLIRFSLNHSPFP